MKKLVSAGLILAMLIMTVYADVASYTVEYDVMSNKIKITGIFEEGKAPDYVALEILNEGVAFQQLQDTPLDFDKIYYIDQKDVGEGVKNFVFELEADGASRLMEASLYGQGFRDSIVFPIKYVNPSDFEAAVDAVNFASKEGLNQFINICKLGNNAFCMGFDTTLSEQVSMDEALRLIYGYAKDQETPFHKEDSDAITKLWSRACLAVLLNKSAVSDITAYENVLDLSDTVVSRWYRFIKQNATAMVRLKELLSSQKYDSIISLDTRLREAVMLTAVQYPDGYANIGNILTDFKDLTKIIRNDENSVYKKLAGVPYGNAEALLSAYQNAGGGEVSSRSGSGSSGSGSSSGGSAISVPVPANGTPQAPTVQMRFVDLDTVSWAYEAISTLADRGILNGKTEMTFAPDATITREEFAKILVCALGVEQESFQNTFSDVSGAAWYASYVNIANQEGICQGVGDGRFGVGQEISRQDMAVMIYNALERKESVVEGAELSFGDSQSIADYAKEAVSVLVSYGAVNGNENGLFQPTGTATRAEAAKMIFGVLDRLR